MPPLFSNRFFFLRGGLRSAYVGNLFTIKVKCRDSEIPPTGELNDPTETRYQTNKIINIFHRETLCTPLYCKVYQPITSKCQPCLGRTDIICRYALKKWLRLNVRIFRTYAVERSKPRRGNPCGCPQTLPNRESTISWGTQICVPYIRSLNCATAS